MTCGWSTSPNAGWLGPATSCRHRRPPGRHRRTGPVGVPVRVGESPAHRPGRGPARPTAAARNLRGDPEPQRPRPGEDGHRPARTAGQCFGNGHDTYRYTDQRAGTIRPGQPDDGPSPGRQARRRAAGGGRWVGPHKSTYPARDGFSARYSGHSGHSRRGAGSPGRWVGAVAGGSGGGARGGGGVAAADRRADRRSVRGDRRQPGAAASGQRPCRRLAAPAMNTPAARPVRRTAGRRQAALRFLVQPGGQVVPGLGFQAMRSGPWWLNRACGVIVRLGNTRRTMLRRAG